MILKCFLIVFGGLGTNFHDLWRLGNPLEIHRFFMPTLRHLRSPQILRTSPGPGDLFPGWVPNNHFSKLRAKLRAEDDEQEIQY